MKYLIVILVVLLVLWLARSSRRTVRREASQPPSSARQQQPMLACAHCGLHLPRDEALPGRGGVFCGEAHRAEYEKAHPAP
ncbi:PP0621 family protein [Piscinibacter sp. XHJ-5]|uniref:PP0621 family protein n=1 Tax=Piscinibacter sp. XHJ-5 TaxID=3037797 RepID=UPI00245339C9|nr:PP0621 family protein [Piscinibacter sp. XHJ-5]